MVFHLINKSKKNNIIIVSSLFFSFCLSFSLVFNLTDFLIPLLDNPSLFFLKPFVIFWKNSHIFQLIIFLVLIIIFTFSLCKFFVPRINKQIQHANRWFLIIGACFIFFLTFLITEQISISPLPLNKTIEIIPQSSGVSLLELKIDENAVDMDALLLGEGWEKFDKMLINSGDGHGSIQYTFRNQTNDPLKLIFLDGKEAGSVLIKINGHDIGFYDLTEEKTVVSEKLIEIPIEEKWATCLLKLIYASSIFLLLVLVLELLICLFKFPALFFTLIFLGNIVFLRIINVPENYYFYQGNLIILYSVSRVIFLVYTLLIFRTIGKLLYRKFDIPFRFTNDLEFNILYLVMGGSILNIFISFLGIIHGLYAIIILLPLIPVVYFSFNDFSRTVHFIVSKLRDITNKAISWVRDFNMQSISISPSQILNTIFVIMALLQAFFVLIVRALPPDQDISTSNDVARHYIPYIQTVIENHSVAPNTVWHHIYYSKYNGLFFYATMFSDKYGPQLITYIYVIISALVLFSIISKLSKSTLLRWFIVCEYLMILWNTDIAFSKLHMMEMSAIVFSFWTASKLLYSEQSKGIRFGLSCAIGLIGISIFSPKGMIFVIPFFVGITILLLLMKKKEEFINSMIILFSLSLSIFLILGSNYLTTGLFDDMVLQTFWSLADQNRFSQWISPYVVLFLIEGYRFIPSLNTFSIHPVPIIWYIQSFVIDKILFFPETWYWGNGQWILFYAIITLLIFFAILGYQKHRHVFLEKSKLFVASSIPIGIAIVLPILLRTSSSLARTFISIIPFILIFLVGLWEMGAATLIPRRYSTGIFNSLLIFGWILLLFNRNGILPLFKENSQYYVRIPNSLIAKGFNYVTGKTSFADFTKTKNADLHDYYEAHQFIGEDERIFSQNLTYSLPGRPIEMEYYFMYKDWHIMAFGSAEKAIQAFQAEGLNYFLLSTDPNKLLVTGIISDSPLFKPDTLPDYFDVIWKSQQTYLLTWKGTSQNPLSWDESFINAYKKKLEKEGFHELYNRIHSYYVSHGTNYPVYPDPNLEPVEGFNKARSLPD